MQCPNCGFENPTQFKFCGECGTKLYRDTTVPDAERRQLTVMFCDLEDSTPLSEQLDPEEMREVLRDYQAVCAKVIRRLEGYIARYFGDGLLVYFGYPQAHEDDAQRAVRAGLEIVEEIARLNPRLEEELNIRLAVRVGIHTGLVVAGDMDEDERLESMAIVGRTPHIANRLQSLAKPNTVVISDATYRLIEGFFDCGNLGVHSLRGFLQPMSLYRVLHESAARSRLEVAANTGLTPLVGRERETELLLKRWTQAVEGQGQVVLIEGEAGIGKSRLVQVLKEHVTQNSQAWLIECRCSPYHQNSALYPVIDLLEHVVLQFDRKDSAYEKLGKLEAFVGQYGFALEEVVPLFASLLSVPLHGKYVLPSLTPERQKQKTFQALLTMLMKRPTQQPVLFIVEDLHWVDASTLEFLDLIIKQLSMQRILILLTFRSDFNRPWGNHPNLTHIQLCNLVRKQTIAMIEKIVGGKALPSQVLQQVVARTDGIPLFVEEFTKMVLESGLLREREDRYELTGVLPSLAIPTTLQDSLMARLDRLGPAKEVAQLGSTLGREFTYELLSSISPLDERVLQRELTRLVEAGLIDQQGTDHAIGTKYTFRHPLIQETAYQLLLKSTRQQYHQQIAQVLTEQFPKTAETQPGLLAYHYTEAGLNELAIGFWQRAGQRAIERSANVEAIGHVTRGIELLKTLTDSRKRSQHELILQTTLGPALIATKGYAAPEVESAYTRARELCRQLGETPQLFPVLFGLWLFYLVRGKLQEARTLGEQITELAQSVKNRTFLLEAHRALGATLYYLGELEEAQACLEKGIALYNSQQHQSPAFLHYWSLADPGMTCLSYSAAILWFLGFPDAARERVRQALRLANELARPFSKVVALHFAALIYQCCGEGQAVQESAGAEIAIAVESGFPLWAAGGTVLRGWALAERGQSKKGIAQMHQGLLDWQATGAEMLRPYFLGLLAEAYGKAGLAGEGFTVLTEAWEIVHRNGEYLYESELYRLKGELMLMQGEAETDVEKCFRQAITVAQSKSAKSLELRGVMSLSRLWQRQGKKVEAQMLLQEIYDWFEEGFDTADLKDAKALLDELS